MDISQEFFTVGQISKFLKLNPLTIYSYIRDKKLVAIRFGRYYRVPSLEFSRFIDKLKVK